MAGELLKKHVETHKARLTIRTAQTSALQNQCDRIGDTLYRKINYVLKQSLLEIYII